MTARQHAEHASALLHGAIKLEEQLAELTPEKRLQLAAMGSFTRINEDLRWTVELAAAHALTAAALATTEPDG